jgi:hypothetical protein
MSKYKNRKIEVDGIVFDSRKEANRYRQLKLLEGAGMIRDLQMQVKFVLIPAQYSKDEFTKKGKPKCIERECSYLADFVYYDEYGDRIVEDVKGYRKDGAYNIFSIKRKLMLQVHGIRIKEI